MSLLIGNLNPKCSKAQVFSVVCQHSELWSLGRGLWIRTLSLLGCSEVVVPGKGAEAGGCSPDLTHTGCSTNTGPSTSLEKDGSPVELEEPRLGRGVASAKILGKSWLGMTKVRWSRPMLAYVILIFIVRGLNPGLVIPLQCSTTELHP